MKIEVRIQASEVASVSPDLWATRLYNKLREAGIPAKPDGSLERGTLHRFDDPQDFGGALYVWTDDSPHSGGFDRG